MTAARALEAAAQAGIAIEVDGGDLILTAPAPPAPDLLELLRSHKTAIVSLLRGNHAWSAEDWQALYDERAAIMEFDGGLPRSEAEARAAEEVSRLRQDLPPDGQSEGLRRD